MRIEVRVKPNARETLVVMRDAETYDVAVHAPPAEGKANGAVVEALAEYFCVAKSRVNIIHGTRGRKKLVEII